MKLITAVLSLILLFLKAIPVYAQENFEIFAKAEYKLENSGKTTVTNTITLKNLNTSVFAKSYIFSLANASPKNIKAYEDGEQLPFSTLSENSLTKIIVEFNNAAVGKGKTKTFVITYEDESISEKQGEVWEITIPRLTKPHEFKHFTTLVSVPSDFGVEAYITPEPRNIVEKEGTKLYIFEKEDLEKTAVTLAFGQFQVFSFTLNYHLENPLNKKSIVEIAIPPDTSTQKVYYQKIEPKPFNVRVDSDGNWLAKYELAGRERLDVKAQGVVQIYLGPRKLTSPSANTLLSNKQPTQYWQSDNPEIQKLAKELKTPRAIYDYVVKTLSYDYKRVKPNSQRLGASEALKNPKSAICTEFTDLFIAIARAAGIPAREINGYAYSENTKIQPLSLVSDVLHAWPEYWDETRGVWVPVDPTWGNTSGVDYFDKFDLRHFAFAIHGENPTYPYPAGSYKLGANPQKDVFVSFGELPNEKTSDIKITHTASTGLNPFKRKIKISLENQGQAAAYDVNPQIFSGNKSLASDYISVMPAYSSYEKSITIQYIPFTKVVPYIVVKVSKSEALIPTQREKFIIYQTIFLTIILLGVVLFVYTKTFKKLINILSLVKVTTSAIFFKKISKWFRNLKK